MNSKATIVVIGSNCFSGSYMVDELLKNSDNFVVGLSRSPEKNALFLPYKTRDHRNFRFYQVDMLREPDKLINLIDLVQPDYIINFAALSEVAISNFQPVDYLQTNTLSLVQLCSQLRSRNYLKKFIQISTAEVYGNCEKPITETSAPNPSTPYAVFKLAADYYLKSLFKVFEFPVIFVRSTNVYGRHQQLFKIIPRTAIYLKTEHKIELHGGGKVVRSFLHIRDLVQGVELVMRKGKLGEIYHFSGIGEPTIASIIQKICDVMKYDFKSAVIPAEIRPGTDNKYLLDWTKAKTELEWTPKISFDDGIGETIDWIESNWKEILNEPLIYIHKF